MTKLGVINQIATAIKGETVAANDIKSALNEIAAAAKGSDVKAQSIAEALSVTNENLENIIGGGGGDITIKNVNQSDLAEVGTAVSFTYNYNYDTTSGDYDLYIAIPISNSTSATNTNNNISLLELDPKYSQTKTSNYTWSQGGVTSNVTLSVIKESTAAPNTERIVITASFVNNNRITDYSGNRIHCYFIVYKKGS